MKKVKKAKKKVTPKKKKYLTKKTTKKTIKKKVAKKVIKKKYKSYYKPKGKKVKQVDELVVTLVPELNVSDVKIPPKLAKEIEKIFAPSKRPVKYLNNRDLLAQVILSKKNISKVT